MVGLVTSRAVVQVHEETPRSRIVLATPASESTIPHEWRALANDLEEGPIPGDTVGAPPIARIMARALGTLDETQTMLLLLLAQGEEASDVASLLEMSVAQVHATRRMAHQDLLDVFDEVWPRFEAWLADTDTHRMRVVRFSESPVDLGPLGSLEPELAMQVFVDIGTIRHHFIQIVRLSGERYLLLDGRRDNRSQVEGLLRERGTLVPVSTVAEESGHDSFTLTHATEAFDGVRRTRDGRLYSAHLSKTQIANLLIHELAARGFTRWNSRALLALMRHFAPDRVGNWNRAALERALERLGTEVVRPMRGSGEWKCTLPQPAQPMTTPAHPNTVPHAVVRTEPTTPTTSTAVPRSAGTVEDLEETPSSVPEDRSARSVDPNLVDEVRRLLLARAAPMTYIELARELATTRREILHVFQSTLIPYGAVATEDGRRWLLATANSGRSREDDDVANTPSVTKRDEGR